MYKGIRLLKEKIGSGHAAGRGDHLIYNLRSYLNRGDEIPINDMSRVGENLKKYHPEIFNNEEGCEFINIRTCLGRRYVIRGIELSLYGMRESGYRKVKISPNLAYNIKGIPGKVPPNAANIVEIWLRKIIKKENGSCQENVKELTLLET